MLLLKEKKESIGGECACGGGWKDNPPLLHSLHNAAQRIHLDPPPTSAPFPLLLSSKGHSSTQPHMLITDVPPLCKLQYGFAVIYLQCPEPSWRRCFSRMHYSRPPPSQPHHPPLKKLIDARIKVRMKNAVVARLPSLSLKGGDGSRAAPARPLSAPLQRGATRRCFTKGAFWWQEKAGHISEQHSDASSG